MSATPRADQGQSSSDFGMASEEKVASPGVVEMVRGVGAAHMVAGGLLLVMVAVSVPLRAGGYINTPLDVIHYASARVFAVMGVLVTAPGANWYQAFRQFAWLDGALRLDPVFWVAMLVVHVNLAALNLAIGDGLRRLRPWARRLEVKLMGPAIALAAIHAGVLLCTRSAVPHLGSFSDLIEMFYSQWTWLFLGSLAAGVSPPLLLSLRPVASQLATAAASQGPARGGRRRRAIRPLKLLVALWMGAVAPGLLILLTMGPLVEIVGLVAWLLRGY